MAYTINPLLVDADFHAIDARTCAALATHGFGVLTEIDVKATMKKKLDVEMPPYRVVGACNPKMAYQAMGMEPRVGAMLPCNVILRKVTGGVEDSAIDRVCGMTVTLKPDTRTERFGDADFHFCSGRCLTNLKADPRFYASGNAARRGKVVVAGVQYTCPMHPQIARDAAGPCPICGMVLEPVLPWDEPSRELTDFSRRMWISAAAALPLVVLRMGPMVGLPVRDWIGHQGASDLEFARATPVVLWAALPFFKRG